MYTWILATRVILVNHYFFSFNCDILHFVGPWYLGISSSRFRQNAAGNEKSDESAEAEKPRRKEKAGPVSGGFAHTLRCWVSVRVYVFINTGYDNKYSILMFLKCVHMIFIKHFLVFEFTKFSIFLFNFLDF